VQLHRQDRHPGSAASGPGECGRARAGPG
jgi:hypothetical protein